MRWTVVAAFVVASPLAAQNGRDPVLKILRHTPSDRAAPGTQVTVTFDRPVAGALDRSVDAARLFRITPAVPGRVSWRDPVTIRFIPDDPLPPGSQVAVTIDTTFSAMDGSRLARPFRFSFRVPGPALLSLDRQSGYGRVLGPNETLALVYSAPVDLAALGRVTRLELTCEGKPEIRLRPIGQRHIRDSDGHEIQYAGGWDADSVARRFRRVVELKPDTPIPGDCDGWLVVPRSLAPHASSAVDRYRVRTRPSFRVERVECGVDSSCAAGAVFLHFSTAVKRVDVERYVRIEPRQAFTVDMGPPEGTEVWVLRAPLAPSTTYTIAIDPRLRDVYNRSLVNGAPRTIVTTDRIPYIAYGSGFLTLSRRGTRALVLHHANVDTALITVVGIPDSARARAFGLGQRWGGEPLHPTGRAVEIRRPLRGSFNRDTTTLLPIDELARRVGGTGLLAIRVEVAAAARPPDSASLSRAPAGLRADRSPVNERSPFVVVQVTELAAHSKLSGSGEGTVFVTGINDGRPRRGALVTLFDQRNLAIARGTTDELGLASLTLLQNRTPLNVVRLSRQHMQQLALTSRYVEVVHNDDRSVTPVGDAVYWRYPPSPLEPYRLGARPRLEAPVAGVVFTDRGIYRPGEMVFAKAIVRTGVLGALQRPARNHSVRWLIKRLPGYGDDDGATIRDTTVALSAFGTSGDSLRLRPTVPLGRYAMEVQLLTDPDTLVAARGEFRVGEYRAPEFLVDVTADTAPRFAHDTVTAHVAARYLFGAPMGNASADWSTVATELSAGQLAIPNTAGWTIGEGGWGRWDVQPATIGATSGDATLDSTGKATLRIPVPSGVSTRPFRLAIEVGVTDVNRQTVTATNAVTVHPAAIYVAARHSTTGWLWNVGTPQPIEVRTVRPTGDAVQGVGVAITVLRRRWALRADSEDNETGVGWRVVTDTIRRDTVQTADRAIGYSFTPREGGEYQLRLVARDEQGRTAVTTLSAYAVGGGRYWWSGDSPYRLPLVARNDRLAVGDTAAVVFESPFERAEAWLTVEREGILEQRRLTVARGTTTVRIPVTERHAPNVFVSLVLVKTTGHGVAPPDSAPQVLRAGYTEVRVDPAIKRLTVSVRVSPREHAPGDTAMVHVTVRDGRTRGSRSEVTLWAVDDGVLALTDYRAPDPVTELYKTRGVGMHLRSTLTSLLLDPALRAIARGAAQRAAARRAAASSGALGARARSEAFLARADTVVRLRGAHVVTTGMEVPVQTVGDIPVEVLRSQFLSTAFFLGDIVTDDTGHAIARVRLPDNLTTYTVFAVAVSDGDQYGGGTASFLVTRALVARPALPRFVRPSDSLVAGAVVNSRDGAAHAVRVDAQVDGATLIGAPRRTITLDPGRGAEARFEFAVPPREAVGGTTVFRFGVSGPTGRDAVESRLDVEPDYHPRSHTIVGVVRDAAAVELRLPDDIDPARSRLRLRVGTSPLVSMLAAYERLSVYPYYCTEQLSSGGRALVAVYRAAGGTRRATTVLGPDPVERLQQLADELTRRQREDGAIGFWRNTDWSSAWLSVHAGLFLLDARAVGVVVEPRVIDKLAQYLSGVAADTLAQGGENPAERLDRRLRLGERVAAIDFLRRSGRAARETETRLLARAADMVWEDRLRLAEVLARRADVASQVRSLFEQAWRGVTAVGGRVDLPDTALSRRDFPSRIRPAARLLTAALAIRPDHPLLGALVETVLRQGRAEHYWAWNTQDYASVVMALAGFGSGAAAEGGRRVTVVAGGQTVLEGIAPPHGETHGGGEAGSGEAAIPLTGLLRRDRSGLALPVRVIAADQGDAVFYALTVEEVPLRPPVTPDVQGIAVERWYERFDSGKPVTSVEEGELVRVRLRVTVPADRQFVVVDDALPAGLEPVDLSLRTSGTLGPFATLESQAAALFGDRDRDGPRWQSWLYGSWDHGWWSPWEHKEIRDDRVVYFARALWKGTYTATYVARATTRGTFVRPPAHAEEMYNPAVRGRSDGGRFVVTGR